MHYEELLSKYIKHIRAEEGTDFINSYDFTEEEYLELIRLSDYTSEQRSRSSREPMKRSNEYSVEVKKLLLKELLEMPYVKTN